MFKKNICIIVTSFLILFSFTGCSKGEQVEPDITAVMSTINSQIAFPDMVDIALDRVDDYYEVDTTTVEEAQLIVAGSGYSPEEVLVIKFLDESDAKTFQSKMDNRLKQVTILFENYGNDASADQIKNCKIEVKNQYAFFAICEDSDTALQIFNDAFEV